MKIIKTGKQRHLWVLCFRRCRAESFCVRYLVQVVPHVEHFLSGQGRDDLSQTLQRLLLAVENCQVEPTERRKGTKWRKKREIMAEFPDNPESQFVKVMIRHFYETAEVTR